MIERGFAAAAIEIGNASKELDIFSEAMSRARNARDLSVLGTNKYSGGNRGDALDDSGRLLQVGGTDFTVPEGSTFDAQAFQRDLGMAQVLRTAPPNPANYVRAPSGSSGSRVSGGTGSATSSGVSDAVAAQQQAIKDALATKFVPAPAPAPSAASSSHTVTLKLPDGTSGTVNMASANDGALLTKLIQQLGESARSGGYPV